MISYKWVSAYYNSKPDPFFRRSRLGYWPCPGYMGDPIEREPRRRKWKFNRWHELGNAAHRYYWRLHGFPDGPR